MGIFNGLMGNASEINLDALIKEYNKILAENERIEKAYKLVRDLFIFTKKTEYHSIPYKSITHFSIETAGHFDLEAELKIWISGNALPIEKQFNSSLNIYELQQVLATYCLR